MRWSDGRQAAGESGGGSAAGRRRGTGAAGEQARWRKGARGGGGTPPTGGKAGRRGGARGGARGAGQSGAPRPPPGRRPGRRAPSPALEAFCLCGGQRATGGAAPRGGRGRGRGRGRDGGVTNSYHESATNPPRTTLHELATSCEGPWVPPRRGTSRTPLRRGRWPRPRCRGRRPAPPGPGPAPREQPRAEPVCHSVTEWQTGGSPSQTVWLGLHRNGGAAAPCEAVGVGFRGPDGCRGGFILIIVDDDDGPCHGPWPTAWVVSQSPRNHHNFFFSG